MKKYNLVSFFIFCFCTAIAHGNPIEVSIQLNDNENKLEGILLGVSDEKIELEFHHSLNRTSLSWTNIEVLHLKNITHISNSNLSPSIYLSFLENWNKLSSLLKHLILSQIDSDNNSLDAYRKLRIIEQLNPKIKEAENKEALQTIKLKSLFQIGLREEAIETGKSILNDFNAFYLSNEFFFYLSKLHFAEGNIHEALQGCVFALERLPRQKDDFIPKLEQFLQELINPNHK